MVFAFLQMSHFPIDCLGGEHSEGLLSLSGLISKAEMGAVALVNADLFQLGGYMLSR